MTNETNMKSVDRRTAEALWVLLDNIDTLGDAHKPEKTPFFGDVMSQAMERFKFFQPDPITQKLVPNVDLTCGLCEASGPEQLTCFELGIVEKLSALEHEQWMHWAGAVLLSEDKLTDDRKFSWAMNSIPYDQLSDDTKEKDRVWARKALDIIRSAKLEEK